MKILLALLLLAYPVFASADETLTLTTYYPSPYGSYNTLYVYNALGVGTTGPNQKLEVSGNIRLTSMDSQLEIGGANQIVSHGWSSYSGVAYPVTQFGAGTGRGDGGSRLFIGLDRYNGNISGAFNGNEIISRANTPWMVPTYANTGYVGIWATDSSDNIQIGRWSLPYNLEAGGVVTIKSDGKVGIGMAPSYQLQLSTDSAAKPSTNTWTVASDKRLKKDIRPYTNGLEIIKKIKPVWFKYNGKAGFPQDNQEHIGVIGQEIIKVAPYTVNTFKARLNPADKKETELLNFNSHALTFDLINSVKELDARITKLAQENQDLKKELAFLKSRR